MSSDNGAPNPGQVAETTKEPPRGKPPMLNVNVIYEPMRFLKIDKVVARKNISQSLPCPSDTMSKHVGRRKHASAIPRSKK